MVWLSLSFQYSITSNFSFFYSENIFDFRNNHIYKIFANAIKDYFTFIFF